MKRVLYIFIFFISPTLYSEGPIKISVKDNIVRAIVKMESDEHITLQEEFVFLKIESEHYDLHFSGYPEGVKQQSGVIWFVDELILEGELKLKPGIKNGNYEFDIILGYQVCRDSGICDNPVEIKERLKEGNNFPIILIILIGGSVTLYLSRGTKRTEGAL